MYTTEVYMTIYRVTSYVSLIKRKRRDGCLMPPFFLDINVFAISFLLELFLLAAPWGCQFQIKE